MADQTRTHTSPFSKTIIYVDMDHVLCDYNKGFAKYQKKYPNLDYPQSRPGFYESLEPMPGAIEAMNWLMSSRDREVFILSAPSLKNPHSYSEKRIWVEQHLGMEAARRLILSSFKGLHRGEYLIDDWTHGKGQEYFEGVLIQFGSDTHPNWDQVCRTIREQEVIFRWVDDVFEDPAIAREWMRTQAPALGGAKPIIAIQDPEFLPRVEGVLERIRNE